MHIRRLLLAISLVGLAACDSDSDADKDDTDGVDTEIDTDESLPETDCPSATAECPPDLASSVPTAGATDGTYDAPIVLNFDGEADPSLVFSLLQGADGAPVALDAASWSEDGMQVVLWPSSPLDPSTEYTLGVAPQCGMCPDVLSFETSATGSSVIADDFDSKTYVLDFARATFARPAGLDNVASVLLAFVTGSTAIVVQGPDNDGQLPMFAGALPDDVNQDACVATLELPAADYTNDPRFEVSAPEGLDLSLGETSVSFERLELSGSFVPGGDAIEGIVVSAEVDTRDLRGLLGDLIAEEAGDDGVCVYIKGVTNDAVACTDCESGEGAFCLDLLMVGLTAEVGSASLQRITDEDVAGDESCGI